jgi:phosphatidylglycerol:prolipoprotein diacylglycerol transferase
MYLVAFAVAFFLTRYQIRERKMNVASDDVINLFFWGIIGLLLGARIFSTLIYDQSGDYWRQPWLIFWPFSQGRFVGFQGLSYHGGLFGIIVASLIYLRVHKMEFWDWADMIGISAPLGYTFGRLGNFINAELYGRVTSSGWGMLFPHAEKVPSNNFAVEEIARETGIEITGPMVNLPRHPSQLYEAFFEGIFLWVVLWFVFRKRRKFKGQLVSLYVIGYGIVRFFIEYFREPDAGLNFPIHLSLVDNPRYLLLTPWNFTMGQILCAIMIVAGVLMYFLLRHKDFREQKIEANGKKKKVDRKLRKRIN